MDQIQESLDNWEDQIKSLYDAESNYLELKASKESLFANLFLSQSGGTIKEREQKAFASKEWGDFNRGLCVAEREYNNEKRKLKLLEKRYEARYLQYKMDNEFIKKSSYGA